MLTLQDWRTALSRRRRVYVDSSSTLLADVRNVGHSRSFSGRVKTISSVRRFQRPTSFNVSPLQLLNSLGKITTPRVPNLMDLASTWASLRYIWAFDPDTQNSNLLLSRYSRNLDFHQKAVLSDDMGVAFSNIIVRHFFNGIWPMPISIALNQRNPVGISKRYKTSPDYIFRGRGGGYIVVECKGTMSSTGYSIKQLGRGIEQVPSIKITGNSPLSLVIGACMMRSRTVINIIDPPDEADNDNSETTFIENIEQFDKELEFFHAANVLRYAGQDELADKVLLENHINNDEMMFNRSIEYISREIGKNGFTGVISPYLFLGNGLRARIFQGISNNILNGFNNNIEKGIQLINNYKKEIVKSLNSLKVIYISKSEYIFYYPNDLKSTHIVSEDGTIMSFEIEEIK